MSHVSKFWLPILFLSSSVAGVSPFEPASDYPKTIEVTGVVRDFKERGVRGGHPDFEVMPSRGFGRYSLNIHMMLGIDDKPRFTGYATKVTREAEDRKGRPISFSLFGLGNSKGDEQMKGNSHRVTCGGGIESEALAEMLAVFFQVPALGLK